MSGITIRAIEPGDISAVLEIQHSSKGAAQWSRDAYEKLFGALVFELAWVAENKGSIIGFIVARRLADELEILNLAVVEAARRQGVGKALLQHAFTHAAGCCVQKVFLEVRASNFAAQRFYESQVFTNAGRRPNYYTSPVEDALLFTRSISELSGKINRNPVLASHREM